MAAPRLSRPMGRVERQMAIGMRRLARSERPERFLQFLDPTGTGIVGVGDDTYVVTDIDLAKEIWQDPSMTGDLTVSEAFGAEDHTLPMGRRSIQALDGEDHRRLKAATNVVLAGDHLRIHGPAMMAEEARQLLGRLVVGQGPQEVVDGFCRPFPARVISRILGTDLDDARFFELTEALAITVELRPFRTDEQNRRAAEASRVLAATFARELADHRPPTTLLGSIGDQIRAGVLTVDDAANVLVFTAVAGYETSSSLLSSLILSLDELEPEAREALVSDPDALDRLIDEVLVRTSPVQFACRATTAPRVWRGVPVEPGCVIAFALGIANRSLLGTDRLRFHIAFGWGAHRCLGAGLARVEAAVGLRTVMEQMPAYRVTEVVDDRPHVTLRALSELWVEPTGARER